ncbi:hypothetical protein MUP56_01725 [Patescibacteria group bacterium]|nr:hypothetical protein [Patescibacteria group bacterium]
MNILTKFSIRISSAAKNEVDKLASLHKNTIILWSSRMTVLLIFSCLTLLLMSWNKLPTQVPLWYSKPWGADRLAPPLYLFLLPSASFGWYIINSLISVHVTKDHLVFSQILFLSSLLVSIFSFVTLGMIIWIIS